jgi:hypothetical protein
VGVDVVVMVVSFVVLGFTDALIIWLCGYEALWYMALV